MFNNLNWKHAVVAIVILGVIAYFVFSKTKYDVTAIHNAIMKNDINSFKAEISKVKTQKEWDSLWDDYKTKFGDLGTDAQSKLGNDATDFLNRTKADIGA